VAFSPALLLMVVAAALCRYRSGHPLRIWRLLGNALLFGLLGPPIGRLVLGTVCPRLPFQEIT